MNTKDNKVWVAIIIVIIIGLVAIFLSKKNVQKSDEALTIGALAPLTGQIAVLGERMRNGMELAKEDLIKEGVVSGLNIIYEDACDGKTTTNAVQKLINADHVKIIGSGFCLFGLDTVVPTIEENKVILFNTAANPESVLNKKYVFSTNINIRDDASRMADYAANQLRAKTVAMIYLDTSFGHSYQTNFSDSFEKLGGRVAVGEAVTPDTVDFRAQVTKIKAAKVDAVIIIHFGISLGNSIKQLREQGVMVPIMGDYESEDPTVIEYAGKAAEGMIISSSQQEVETALVKSFQERYKAKYGEAADVLATNAYDSLQLQIRSYVACDGDTDCMSKKLAVTKNYDGVSGRITINPKDHSVTKPTIYKVVKNGQFVTLQ